MNMHWITFSFDMNNWYIRTDAVSSAMLPHHRRSGTCSFPAMATPVVAIRAGQHIVHNDGSTTATVSGARGHPWRPAPSGGCKAGEGNGARGGHPLGGALVSSSAWGRGTERDGRAKGSGVATTGGKAGEMRGCVGGTRGDVRADADLEWICKIS